MSLFSTLVFSLLISLFFANQFTTIEGSSFQNLEIIVKITNALKAKNQLIFHCKSCGDDFGVHKLTPWANCNLTFVKIYGSQHCFTVPSNGLAHCVTLIFTQIREIEKIAK